ncbi:2-hydroxyacid dehydrogenase [Paracoccus sp. Ld10]|uniref:2-hydroxyacid dehydrogenase n=1 Tax=Paracoccus sp. Ld10 TaxID=649158 RepID=UPI0038650C89
MKPDVLMLSPTRPAAQSRLEELFTLHRMDLAQDKPAFLARHGATCRGMVATGHITVDAGLLDQLPALEIISCGSAGYDAFDVDAIARRGIALTNASPALAQEVADMALLLAQVGWRNVVAADAWVRSGDWARKGAFPLQRSFRGRRLGVVGMGTIGHQIADLATAQGLQVTYWNRREKDTGYPFQPDLEQLARDSDILIAIVAGGPDTQGLISDRVLRALGPEGLFVNVARGSVMDEPALIAALQDGGLGGAALDVFWSEPNPDPRLIALHNVILSPHQGSGTVQTRDAMASLVVDNLQAHFTGQPLISAVDLTRS